MTQTLGGGTELAFPVGATIPGLTAAYAQPQLQTTALTDQYLSGLSSIGGLPGLIQGNALAQTALPRGMPVAPDLTGTPGIQLANLQQQQTLQTAGALGVLPMHPTTTSATPTTTTAGNSSSTANAQQPVSWLVGPSNRDYVWVYQN